eukprot:TRINITY_DN103966_c0_g1_i1.p1 TRINITY_DN103966_c0_g1~~TRINITY_DN103966_c0_g1_i1.p1  ORF type:complete len:221 (-),score=38.94 TRINITY_DN103966_c0_g1_i1:52-714(-)
MWSFVSSVLPLAILFQNSVCAGGESAVVVLTDKNFEELVGRGEGLPWAVKFYAPWCGHCKYLKPTWEKLAENLKGKVQVGTLDATESPWISDQFGVDGFPTLKMISAGKQYSFSDKRNLETLEAWALGGFRKQQGEALPQDQPWYARAFAFASTFCQVNVMFIVPLMVLLPFALFCCSPGPSPEQLAKRKAFEDQMQAMEAKMKEQQAQNMAAEETKKDS